MKIKSLLASLTFSLAFVSQANAGDWFNDVAADMGRLENLNGVYWLMPPLNDTIGMRNVNGCEYSQVHFSPPAGQAESWHSIILASLMAKKKINVFAECDSASKTLNATRLIMEF